MLFQVVFLRSSFWDRVCWTVYISILRKDLGINTVRKETAAEGDVKHWCRPFDISSDPTGSPGTRMTIRVVLSWTKMAMALYKCMHQSVDVNHPGKGHDLRWGSSLQPRWSKLTMTQGCWWQHSQETGSVSLPMKGRLGQRITVSYVSALGWRLGSLHLEDGTAILKLLHLRTPLPS